jgi:hypothetical protein
MLRGISNERRHFDGDRRVIWSTNDNYLTVFDGSSSKYCPRDSFLAIWNKPTSVYFEQTAQYGCNDEVKGYPCTTRRMIAAIYKTWCVYCGENFNLELGHLMANPVSITKRGPQTLQGICAAHTDFCAIAKTQEPKRWKLVFAEVLSARHLGVR